MKMNAIKQMEDYSRYHPGVISLSQGIPSSYSDERIRREVIAAINNNVVDNYSDPQGMKKLREEIASSLSVDDLQYTSDEILVTTGATEGIMATLLQFLSPGRDEVILPTPTYAAYFKMIEVAGGKVIPVQLNEEKDWELDVSLLEKNLTKNTAVILLCNPNNPTGSVYPKEILQKICVFAKENNLIVILDEVYKNMIFDENSFYSPAIEEEFEKTIISVVSFSKDFSLTGWRVAFLQSHQEIIQKILPVHDAISNCAPVVSQYAALAALKYKESIINEHKTIYKKQRDLMKKYLDKLSDYFTYTLPQGSYFVFPRFIKEQNAEKFCLDLLREGEVALVPGNDFGPGGENHIRICFGRKENDIREGMERLTKYITDTLI